MAIENPVYFTNTSKKTSDVSAKESPVMGVTWEEFQSLKKWLPPYDPGCSNIERLKWITYLNRTRNTSDGFTSLGSKNLNTAKVQEKYDELSKLADSVGATDSYVARNLRKLKHINSLQTITAKTALGVDSFFSSATDRIGSTVTDVLNSVDDAASFALDQLQVAAAGIRKATAEYKTRRAQEDAAAANSDKAIPGNTATRGIFKRYGNDVFNTGWSSLNAKMKENRLANIPGDMFNSARTLFFVIREELEQAIDAIHQIFQNIQAKIIKLIRKIKLAIKLIVTMLMSALDYILEVTGIAGLIENILTDVGSFLKDVGENLKNFVNNLLGASGEDIMINIFEDLNKEINEIITKGIFTYMWESLGANIRLAIPGLNKLSDIQNKIETPLVNSLRVLKRYSDINWLISQLPKDAQRTLGIIQAFSTNAKGFIGNGIRSLFVKYALNGKRSLFLGNAKKRSGVSFTFSQPFHYGSSQYQYNPTMNPIFVLPRLAIDGTGYAVDRTGNKLNYSAYTNRRLF